MKQVLVRCGDKTVFPINPVTTEALSTGYYDPYCYSDPRKDVEYMEYSEWLRQCDKRWSKYYESTRSKPSK